MLTCHLNKWYPCCCCCCQTPDEDEESEDEQAHVLIKYIVPPSAQEEFEKAWDKAEEVGALASSNYLTFKE